MSDLSLPTIKAGEVYTDSFNRQWKCIGYISIDDQQFTNAVDAMPLSTRNGAHAYQPIAQAHLQLISGGIDSANKQKRAS